jgi:hypothetical protein
MKLQLLFSVTLANQCNLVRVAYQEMGGRQPVPSNCCSFQGVTCNRQGQVTDIIWNNQFLNGRISPAIANLPELIALDLSENQLNGEIPSEFEFLNKLKTLELRQNRLSGAIPFELSFMTALEVLSLGSNQLAGPIPSALGNLSQLRFLFLSSNRLTGELPTELGNLSKLSILTIDSNPLSGSIPASLGELPLQRFDFANTQLNGPLVGDYSRLLSCSGFNTNVCRNSVGPSPRICNLPVCAGTPIPTSRPTSRPTSNPTTTSTARPTSTQPAVTSRPRTTATDASPSTRSSSSIRTGPPTPTPSSPPSQGECRYFISPLFPIPDLDGVVTAKALFRRLLSRVGVSSEVQRGTLLIPTDSTAMSIALGYEATLTTFESRNIVLNNLVNQFKDDYLFPTSVKVECFEPIYGKVEATLSIAGQARVAQ